MDTTSDRTLKKDERSPELEETSSRLACFRLNHAGHPTERQRTILLTGVARGGTSFIGSAAGRLGVPFRRHDRDKVSGHWEHVELRSAFKDKDAGAFEAIVAEFNQVHETWAWKLPALRTDFEWVVNRVRNPCFVFSFKEPLSMAMRKISTGHAEDLQKHFKRIFRDYMDLLAFAEATERPVMLVSYDKALRQLDECIAAIARFCGIENYDLSAVKRGIEEDAQRY